MAKTFTPSHCQPTWAAVSGLSRTPKFFQASLCLRWPTAHGATEKEPKRKRLSSVDPPNQNWRLPSCLTNGGFPKTKQTQMAAPTCPGGVVPANESARDEENLNRWKRVVSPKTRLYVCKYICMYVICGLYARSSQLGGSMGRAGDDRALRHAPCMWGYKPSDRLSWCAVSIDSLHSVRPWKKGSSKHPRATNKHNCLVIGHLRFETVCKRSVGK